MNRLHLEPHCLVDGHDTEEHIGDGTKVWAFATIERGARIGKNCVIGMYAHIGRKVTVGNGCKLQNGAQLFEGVVLEDDVFIGPNVVFTNVLLPRAFQKATEYKPTLVKRGASIGANATIVCDVTIGEYAMVGAGAVVTKNVKPHRLVVGNPAQEIGFVCRCGRRIFPPGRIGNEINTEITAPCSSCRAQITMIFTRLHPYNATDVRITDAA